MFIPNTNTSDGITGDSDSLKGFYMLDGSDAALEIAMYKGKAALFIAEGIDEFNFSLDGSYESATVPFPGTAAWYIKGDCVLTIDRIKLPGI